MTRLLLLTLALSAMLACAMSSDNERMKRQGDPLTNFVGPEDIKREREEARQRLDRNDDHDDDSDGDDDDDDDDDRDDRRHHGHHGHHHDDDDSFDNDDRFDSRRPQVLPRPIFIVPGGVPPMVQPPMPPTPFQPTPTFAEPPLMVQPPAPTGPMNPTETFPDPLLMVQPPAPTEPMDFQPLPPQPLVQPVEAFEGDNGVDVPFTEPVIEEIPSSTPPPPSTTPLPSSTLEGLVPELTLTCETVKCMGGSVCRMENNINSGREEATCVFLGDGFHSSCDDVRCQIGFRCQMKQSSSCSRLPCPLNAVCIEA